MTEEKVPERKVRKREEGVLAIGRIQKHLDELDSPEARIRVLEYCMSEVRESMYKPAGTGMMLPPGPPKQPDLPFNEAKRNGFGLDQ